jgi:hypothetical protein
MISYKLKAAAISGSWEEIDLSAITKEMLSKDTNSSNKTIFHYAAESRKLEKVPKCLWFNDLFLKRDKWDDTVLHIAAYSKKGFHLIPKELLTKENLLDKRNIYNYTVLGILAKNQPLTILPKELLGNLRPALGRCLAIAIESLVASKDMEPEREKIVKGNINYILSKLNKQELNESLKAYEERDLIPEIKDYIKKRLIREKFSKDDGFEI